MEIQVIGFIPPVVGIDGEFNTFRMGRKLSKLPEGEDVLLMDEKKKAVIGMAKVTYVDSGTLSEMRVLYASQNHTELATKSENPSESLYKTILKIYGPHIVNPSKIFTVVGLRRVE